MGDKDTGKSKKKLKEEFMDKCGDAHGIAKLGSCCELKKGYSVVLKPAKKFVPPKCLTSGRYTESVHFKWSCYQGYKISGPKDAFFRQCNKCLQKGYVHGS